MPRILKSTLWFFLALIILVLMWFLGILGEGNFYNYIGTKNEVVPNYALMVFGTCIVTIFVMTLINAVFYGRYSRRNYFEKRSFHFQLTVNIVYLIASTAVLIFLAVGVNSSVNMLIEDTVINNVQTSWLLMILLICIILNLLLSFFQVCIYPPMDRFAPIWKNNFDTDNRQ